MSALGRRALRPLWAATAVVATLGVAAELLRFGAGIGPPFSLVLDELSLSYEHNLPTWYASSLLLACAACLAQRAAVAGGQQQVADGHAMVFRRHWAALAAMFAYLSFDETAGLHEQLNRFGPLPGIFHFAWVIPAAVIVALVGVAYLRFVAQLPPPLRRRVIAAGTLYVGGALGVELALGAWTGAYGTMNVGYRLIDALEESLELCGATLFLTTLLSPPADPSAGDPRADPRADPHADPRAA